MRIVLKRGRLLVQGLFTSFLSKERIWLKRFPLRSIRKGVIVQRIVDTISVSKKGLWLKEFPKNGQFSVTCPKASIKVISKYHDFGTCIFGY